MIRSVGKMLVAGLFVTIPALCSAQEANPGQTGQAAIPPAPPAIEDPAENPAREGFVPQWKIGDQWILEATYRDQRAPGEVWMTPIRWTFHVKAKKNIHRTDCYVLHIYPKKSRLKMQAILYLSVRDLRPMRVIEIFPTAFGVKSREKPVDPFHAEPLIGDDTLVPYDLPVFPLMRTVLQRADGFGAYAAPEPKVYEKIRKVAGFSFKREMRQTDAKPDRQHADAFAAYRLGGETFQVELADSRLGTAQTQLWQEGSPWAISTESRNRRVRLVPPAAPETLPVLPSVTDDSKEGEE
ncbi:MAG TPA: hypothetical protein PLP29_17955 [Candidatus Ozemobacteraceae bacterium]|nr:hypothetical protein [Candidatus Ozemobacteraceae bacterium]